MLSHPRVCEPQFASSYVFVRRYLADAGVRVQQFCSNLSQLLLDTVPELVHPPRIPSCSCSGSFMLPLSHGFTYLIIVCLACESDASCPLRPVRGCGAGARALLFARNP